MHMANQTNLPEEGLDTIPVNKAPVGLIVGVLVALLAVGGTVAWSMGGGVKRPAQESSPVPSAQDAGLSKEELEKQREFLQMTERAMARAEESQKVKEAEEAAKKTEAEEEPKEEAKKGGRSGPAPVSGPAANKAA